MYIYIYAGIKITTSLFNKPRLLRPISITEWEGLVPCRSEIGPSLFMLQHRADLRKPTADTWNVSFNSILPLGTFGGGVHP